VNQDFKYIVVGRGLMGAAAARHLARATDGIAVIGPDEPADKKSHTGVFASHYDEGRITRTIDPDRDWARLANRSIARYPEIERESGISFYTPAGCLVVGPARGNADDYIARTVDAAAALGAETTIADDADLKRRFPYFSFPAGSEGVHEAAGAGYISPRNLVRAQSAAAEKAGAAIIGDVAVSIHDEGDVVAVETSSGKTYRGEKVLLAAGGFSIADIRCQHFAVPVENIGTRRHQPVRWQNTRHDIRIADCIFDETAADHAVNAEEPDDQKTDAALGLA
jgi:glycine/D-amino acid oxidase-like deaminating enzyme